MPTPPGHPRVERRLRLFAANELNAVGWLALVAVMLLGGAAAGIAAHAFDLPVLVCALAGSALVLALAVAADRHHLRSIYTGYSRWSPDEAAEVEALASRLRGMGYDVTYEPADPDEPGSQPGLTVRVRDWHAVRRLIDAPR